MIHMVDHKSPRDPDIETIYGLPDPKAYELCKLISSSDKQTIVFGYHLICGSAQKDLEEFGRKNLNKFTNALFKKNNVEYLGSIKNKKNGKYIKDKYSEPRRFGFFYGTHDWKQERYGSKEDQFKNLIPVIQSNWANYVSQQIGVGINKVIEYFNDFKLAEPLTLPEACSNTRSPISEVKILERDFEEDNLLIKPLPPEIVERTVKVRKRNQAAVAKLKKLYNKCQITDDKYVFETKDSVIANEKGKVFYTEAHHLIPLSENGADSPENIIIVSPLVHRMLHHADVSEIDLKKIQHNDNGTATLEIHLNGDRYLIEWKRQHAEVVEKTNPTG